MKFRVIDILGQPHVFTQYDDKGNPQTLRLNSRKSIIVEANSKETLPKDILLEEKARFIFIEQVTEDNDTFDY